MIKFFYIDNLIINDSGNKHYEIGDYVHITGNIKLPIINTNFNLFNYRNCLYSKKIYYVMNANKIEKIKKSNNILYSLKRIIFNRINSIRNNEYLFLFILGDNSYIIDDMKESYSLNLISHIFSISGMHISLYVSILLYSE